MFWRFYFLSSAEKFLYSFLIGLAALIWLQQHYMFTIVQTPSLPYKAILVKKGEPVQRGDIVAFKWRGGLGYEKGAVMEKIVAAAPGDTVERFGQKFVVNGDVVAVALTHTLAGHPVQAATGGVVPQDQYFVVATNPISLDSRYAKFGNVQKEEVIGRAYPLW